MTRLEKIKRKERPLLGLEKTLAVLTRTPNEAAVAVLVPALDSPHPEVQQGALQALLDRRSPTGQREVLRRLHLRADSWRPLIDQRRGRMTATLRDAVLGSDLQMATNACQAMLWFREYDLVPTLLAASEDQTHPHADLAAATLSELIDLLYDELSAPRDYQNRRDPQLVRRHVTSSLETAVSEYLKHGRREVLSAFLVLAARDNAVLKQVLQDPHHAAYLHLVDELLHNARGGVVRLLLSFLDDPHAPSAAIAVIGRRRDAKFLPNLLRKIGYEPSAAAAQNLKRIDSIPWLRGDDYTLVDEFDDASQHSLVQLVMASGMKRLEVFRTIEHLALRGKAGGRRAAAKALAQFKGAEANSLALRAVEDSDPEVQAAIAMQLRERGIPGTLARLVDMVDSPYEVVRTAARESLGEFSFERYLAAFSMLDEDVRASTGVLVRKINPESIPTLRDEMLTRSRTRRLRALAVASAMGAIGEMESTVLELLSDEDHLVRIEAARALGQCDTLAVRQALREALVDRSVVVQEAAEKSLRQLESRPVTTVGAQEEPA